MALDELEARLRSGRAFSAVVIDAAVAGLDRDLVDEARRAGAAVLVVDAGQVRRDWPGLGVDAVMADPLDRATLRAVLAERARPLHGPEVEPGHVVAPAPPGWRGRLVTVLGAPGGGTSTVAMAAAQGLGASTATGEGPSARRHAQRLDAAPSPVVLADLALHADQALLHDAGDVVPGLQELVEAHRAGALAVEQVHALTFAVPERGYDLLLGLRRHRDWTVLRPRAVQAAVDGLRRAYALVVADADADLEGDDEVGSVDVEERNVLARTAAAHADVVVVAGTPSLTGLRRLVVVLDDLVRLGVEPSRVLTVVTRAPRRGRPRAEVARAVAELSAAAAPGLRALASPVFVPERRGLDHLQRAASPLPRAVVQPVARAVEALLDRQPVVPHDGANDQPVAITPGSLGAWPGREVPG